MHTLSGIARLALAITAVATLAVATSCQGCSALSGGPTSTPRPTPTPTPVPPTPTPRPPDSVLEIIAVDKRAEFVDVQNVGELNQDLTGWVLLSEKGHQECALEGKLPPGEVLRIWAMAEDSGEAGFNCGFDANIWNNSETDAAVLFNFDGEEVSRY